MTDDEPVEGGGGAGERDPDEEEAAATDGGESDAEGATSAARGARRGGDDVAEVELGLYQVSVRVKGTDDDDLAAVEETATRLVDHLVERASTLEEEPDQRGLG